MKNSWVLLLLFCAFPVAADVLPLCENDAISRARALVRFHDPVLAMSRPESELSVERPQVQGELTSSSDPAVVYPVLALEAGYMGVASGYRVRLVYEVLDEGLAESVSGEDRCLLVGQEILFLQR